MGDGDNFAEHVGDVASKNEVAEFGVVIVGLIGRDFMLLDDADA